MSNPTYTITKDAAQAIVNILNQLPASQSRGVLNYLEQTFAAQDKEQADKLAAEAKEKLRAEILAEAEADESQP